MPNANDDGGVSSDGDGSRGCACSHEGSGSCHGSGSRSCVGDREGDCSHNADGSCDGNGSGHGNGSRDGVDPHVSALMPRKAMRLLPNVDVPVTLRHGCKEWAGTYNGSYTRPIINKDAWKPFVNDNHLKAGDICIFELLKICEESGVLLKVVYLKGLFEFPEELLSKTLAGSSEEHAIVVD